MAADRTTKAETFVTRLGMWGAVRSLCPLAAAILGSIALLETLAPSAARLFPALPSSTLHFFAVTIGLLLGLVAHYGAEFWDRVAFPAWYGMHGRWLAPRRPPLPFFPTGEELKRAREEALQFLPRKPGTDDPDREAVKLARRQAERWARIERPALLAGVVRGLLWPALFVAALAAAAALAAGLAGQREALRLLAVAAGGGVLALLLLGPYTHLRLEYLTRLYRDVTGHAHKKRERH